MNLAKLKRRIRSARRASTRPLAAARERPLRSRWQAGWVLAIALGGYGCAPTWSPPGTNFAPQMIAVERPCTLPGLEVPAVSATRCNADQRGWACYDAQNAKRLQQQLEVMQRWIQHARQRCVVEVSSNSLYGRQLRANFDQNGRLVAQGPEREQRPAIQQAATRAWTSSRAN